MKVYLDNAATTKTSDAVIKAMMPYFNEIYGNASSQHAFGQDAAKAVERARMQVAEAINAHPSEIYFTSGGTESDNHAIKGIAYANANKGKHIITSAIEHPAVINSCKSLEKQGFEVTYIGVDADGLIKLDEIRKAIRPDTVLISVMTANNEVGTIQPIAEIGALARERKIVFHTDAVQAVGAVDIDVKAMNVDLLSMSGHKFYGPKGVGVLYIRNGLRIDRFMTGGEQERNMRAGTSNTPGIVGIGVAIEQAKLNFKKIDEMAKLRDYMRDRIVKEIPYVKINGSMSKRLPNNLNVSFQYVEGESILLSLDLDGIAASSGSACSSGSLEPSHVLLAMGLTAELAHGSIRFSLCKDTTKREIDYTVDCLKTVIEKLRYMSPLFKPDDKGAINV